ncbi:MAG: DMT family transporter [Candidatus Undinarchaeales archaeon]|jgi:drug/metabolite transporter (DMT)-like permease|nr:DMT family transporter [Candidatus Undinarchaeales archaeon]MDP7492493.1 DMT family transporter [Candidatus Undinarchaeales archaeon]
MSLNEGIFYAFGAALCFAMCPVFFERGAKDLPSPFASLVRLAAPLTVLTLIVAMAPFASEVLAVSDTHVALILAGGVVNLAIADTLLIRAISAIGVSRAVSISSVYPLFVMLILGESIVVRTLIGITLVMMGIYLVSTSRSEEGAIYKPSEDHQRYGFGLGRALRPAYTLKRLRATTSVLTKDAFMHSNYGMGIALSLGAALCWAVGISIFKTVVDAVRPEILNLYRLTGGFVFMMVINAMTRNMRSNMSLLSGRRVALLSIGGVVGSVFGSILT